MTTPVPTAGQLNAWETSGSSPGDRPRCAATRKSGGPCPVRPRTGSRYCYQHDPDPQIGAHRTLARQRGGFRTTEIAGRTKCEHGFEHSIKRCVMCRSQRVWRRLGIIDLDW